jgi:predicted anti-sigma-YlaC factor YlaD
MDCRDFRRQYSAYRDGHEPELAADIDDHIESCSACAAFDRAVREGIETLRGEQVVPSPDFRDRLSRRLASAEVVADPLPPRVSPWAATIAAGLFLALMGLSLKTLVVLPPPVAAEMQPMVIAQPKLVPGIPFVIFERIPTAAK